MSTAPVRVPPTLSLRRCGHPSASFRARWEAFGLDDYRLSLRVWERRVKRLLREPRPVRCLDCHPRGNPPPAPHTHGYHAKTRGRNRR